MASPFIIMYDMNEMIWNVFTVHTVNAFYFVKTIFMRKIKCFDLVFLFFWGVSMKILSKF